MNKFDAIGNAHEEALKAMGVIDDASIKKREAPELPKDLAHIYDKYRRIKFAITSNEDGILLRPRPMLTYTEINAFMQASHSEFYPWEVELIMNIDAIFEGRDNG